MLDLMHSKAGRDVLAERKRQIEAEGWTPEHDDRHDCGEIAAAAACYATRSEDLEMIDGYWTDGARLPESVYIPRRPRGWPWHGDWWKPKDRRSDLVRAGALYIAEKERLERRYERDLRNFEAVGIRGPHAAGLRPKEPYTGHFDKRLAAIVAEIEQIDLVTAEPEEAAHG